jgi:non-heme chloroperoxidase
MGGGEVAHYIGKYGSTRVSKAVFISAITPYLLKTADNPEGVDGSVFEGIKQAIIPDRPAFLTAFFSNFYNVDALIGKRISEEVVRYSWNVGVGASPTGTLECVNAWVTDLRKDLAHIDVSTLVIHGDSDRILPAAVTAKRMAKAVKGAKVVVLEGGPHGLTWTHAEEVNKELVKKFK